MGMTLGGRGRARATPDMNVTPLVDVVLVLLIIFMVLAPVLTESFGVRLPPKDDADKQLDQANDPSQPLVLTVTENDDVEVNGVRLDREDLPGRLSRMFNARPDNVLYLDGADEVGFGQVMTAIELARKGGAAPVVMITKKLE